MPRDSALGQEIEAMRKAKERKAKQEERAKQKRREKLPMTVLYRYEDVAYAAPVNVFDEPSGRGTVEVHLRTFKVVSKTPHGVWIDMGYGIAVDRKWIRADARRRFAYPTIAEARLSFLARKRRQISILHAQIQRAQEAIRKLKELSEAPSDSETRPEAEENA